jgi:hypothetical protein
VVGYQGSPNGEFLGGVSKREKEELMSIETTLLNGLVSILIIVKQMT